MFFDREIRKMSKYSVPNHIAIIMDGNGRWARKKKLSRNAGHKKGADTLKNIVNFCNSIGIKYLTVYAFSTENWKRPQPEIDTLMILLLNYLKNASEYVNVENGSKMSIKVIGNVQKLSDEIQQEIIKVEESTQNNEGLTFVIALNYGGRDEILQAAKGLAMDAKEQGLDLEHITEADFGKRLYTKGIPDPDLVIRTSGENRISNFLLWQSAYSELWYTKINWPDFNPYHMTKALRSYNKRNRRYGGI